MILYVYISWMLQNFVLLKGVASKYQKSTFVDYVSICPKKLM